MPHESKLSIETVDRLISIAINGIPEGITSISIAEHLSTIKIRVCGEGYEAAIPGEQLRTLWELQADLYRLAAFALHGSTDIRVLSQEERQQFELKVKVEKGSFVSNIETSDFWSALFVNAVGKMSGVEIGLTIGGCALIICGKLIWDRYNQRLEILAKENTQQKQTEALVKQNEDLVRVVEAFTATGQNTAKSCIEKTSNVISTTAERFAKRGHKISSLEVAGMTYNEQDIEKLKERSRSDPTPVDTVSDLYQILAIDKGIDPWSIKIREDFGGNECNVRFAKAAIDGDGEKAASDLLEAFSQDKFVQLEITLGKKRNLINSVELIDPPTVEK